MARLHPFTFISPWPKSSPYYYKPSKVQYAMLFREGGYYIHDAPWRSAFGPGTNAQLGTPGTNYTGTHGCINVPADVAKKLFFWAPVGTVVQVVG
jgi:lipoprotein-anchoring transpeptidase ErfK/SrfK